MWQIKLANLGSLPNVNSLLGKENFSAELRKMLDFLVKNHENENERMRME